MSFFSFNLIGNALDAYTEATTVTSDNIANVATPGASRQSATITEQQPISGSPYYSAHVGSPGTRGEGAIVNQIARIHQDSYDTLFRGASTSQYFYTAENQQLTSLQSNFGEPNNGISSTFSEFQTAISNLSASPTQTAVRNTVLSKAQAFATALNAASSAVTQQKASSQQQATGVVSEANTLIDQIATLNGQIRSLTATGDNPNTYLDQRDHAIDALAQFVPLTTTLQANGSALVAIDGRPLVNDTVGYHLASPVLGTTANGLPQLVVGFAGDANPNNPTPIPLSGGKLGAFLDVYNNKLVPYGQQLDNFASATADEMNRITQAGVDLNGNVGTAIFNKAPGTTAITAASISVAITDPTQIPAGLISTAAGNLTQPMNSANNVVSTSVAIDGNVTFRNAPPAGGVNGTLTINVDGVAQTFHYDTAATTPTTVAGVTTYPADTIGDFMTNFNNGHFGVTATFDASTQTIAFSRDPNNIDAVHRGLQGANAPTAGFTITDSNVPPNPASVQGTAAGGLLETLGAGNIQGVAQTPANALGTADNADANALLKLFTQNVGVGALQTTAGAVTGAAPGSLTITEPSFGAFSTINVGQVLTVVNAATNTQQNVAVTAINRLTGTITVTASAAVNAADWITTAPAQTLGAAYQSLVARMAIDTQTSTTGLSTQTGLASSIDQARQSVDGINIDEETQSLLKFQSAYTAAAKTLSTLNSIMQTTLNLITGG